MATKKYKCNICGYIHEGDAAPASCPVCSAPAAEFSEIKEEAPVAGRKKRKGLFGDTNSNAYIILYSTVMVAVVATLLALAALGLKERQYANDLNEKKKSILLSLYAGEAQQQGIPAEELIATVNYDEMIDAYAVDKLGQRIGGIGDQEVFALLNDLPGAYAAGKYPIFEARDGRVVIPVTGMGLWGPVWGYVALEKDMDTIAGIIMAHKGETPGLGAEIATTKYQSKFIGKTIFEGDEFVSIALRKGGAKDPAHEVDAITGGTKTSDGVTAMLYESLKNYLPLLESKRHDAAEAAMRELMLDPALAADSVAGVQGMVPAAVAGDSTAVSAPTAAASVRTATTTATATSPATAPATVNVKTPTAATTTATAAPAAVRTRTRTRTGTGTATSPATAPATVNVKTPTAAATTATAAPAAVKTAPAATATATAPATVNVKTPTASTTTAAPAAASAAVNATPSTMPAPAAPATSAATAPAAASAAGAAQAAAQGEVSNVENVENNE